MELAEKFDLPVVTFVDTPGAYPGIDAEERGQSEAIGRNLFEMAGLRVPVITCVIGEGGSGGALAIAVADIVMMLQYSTYSVISPEGCASILWKDAGQAPRAAEALALTADRLSKLGLVDRVISEPLGGAHRDPKLMAAALKKTLIDELRKVMSLSSDELRERRLARIMSYGRFETVQTPETEEKKTAETLKAAALTAVDAVEAKAEDKTEAEPAAKKPAARKPRSKKADEGDAGAAAEPVKKAAAKKSPAKPRTANKAFVGDFKRGVLFADRKDLGLRWADNEIYGQYLQAVLRFGVTKVDAKAGYYVTYTPAP
jgi:acetyl-CoA carboxylase carboxyl transferase subunit alpha